MSQQCSVKPATVSDSLPNLSAIAPAVMENLPAGVIILDCHGRVNYCNPLAEELLGDSLLGQAWADIIHRCIAPESSVAGLISLKNGLSVSMATQSLNQSGQLILIQDLTQTTQLQKKLKHYERLSTMGQMAASLAHQIRTPLTGALLYANHLGKPNLLPSQQQQFSQKLLARLREIEQQVANMLAYSKAGTSVFEAITLIDFQQQIVAAIEPIEKQNQVAIHYQLLKEPLRLRLNPSLVIGALTNGIHNAIEAKAKKLWVTVKRGNNHVMFSVEDNGQGMSESVQQAALDPFYSTKSSGTGLGLAIAKCVCETHGGSLSLQSTAGRGTTICLSLPYQTEG